MWRMARQGKGCREFAWATFDIKMYVSKEGFRIVPDIVAKHCESIGPRKKTQNKR